MLIWQGGNLLGLAAEWGALQLREPKREVVLILLRE